MRDSVSFSAIFQHKLQNSTHFSSSPVPLPDFYFDSFSYPVASVSNAGGIV